MHLYHKPLFIQASSLASPCPIASALPHLHLARPEHPSALATYCSKVTRYLSEKEVREACYAVLLELYCWASTMPKSAMLIDDAQKRQLDLKYQALPEKDRVRQRNAQKRHYRGYAIQRKVDLSYSLDRPTAFRFGRIITA